MTPPRPWPAALLLLAALAARAQTTPPDLTGVVSGQGFTRIKIAIPDAVAEAAPASSAAEFSSTLRDDLAFSGYFDIVDPLLYPKVATSAEKTEADRWMSIGAAALAVTRLRIEGSRVDLRATLSDTQHGAVLFDKRYGGSTELLRRVAHQVADDIVRQFTGRPGVSLTRISFVSKHGEGSELYLMDYDGFRVRRMTTSSTINLSPAWSPDGERLAFVSWREGPPRVHILDGSGKLTRVPTVGSSMTSSPSWSPDGKRLAYAANADGNVEIFVLDIASGRNTRLTRSAAIDTAPAFSPNGREIAFTSDRSGSPQIYVMDAEGLDVRRVSQDGNWNDEPAWSPRGDKLAYASRIDGRFNIVVRDVATGVVMPLTHGEGNNESPRWASDGRHIVFASNRTGTWDIWTMLADGSQLRRLTQGVDSYTPDWSARP